MRKIEVVRWRAFTLEYSSKAVELRLRDWRKIRRVLRAAEVVAKHRKHSFRDLRLAAHLAGIAVDALNRETKK